MMGLLALFASSHADAKPTVIRGFRVAPVEGEPTVRSALLIGNGAYSHLPPLRNPVRDVGLMAKMLRASGFDEVFVHEDVSRRKLEPIVDEFTRKVRERGGLALVYYSGHGVEVKGRNYLLPVDLEPGTAGQVQFGGAVSLDYLLGSLERSNGPNVIILDACRNDPVARRATGIQAGLGHVVAPSGSLIAYATAPGDFASDGKGSNSPFARALAAHLLVPGLEIRDALTRVRRDVRNATETVQTPWDSSSLLGQIFLGGPPSEENLAVPSLPSTGRETSISRMFVLNQDLGDYAILEPEKPGNWPPHLSPLSIQFRWSPWASREGAGLTSSFLTKERCVEVFRAQVFDLHGRKKTFVSAAAGAHRVERERRARAHLADLLEFARTQDLLTFEPWAMECVDDPSSPKHVIIREAEWKDDEQWLAALEQTSPSQQFGLGPLRLGMHSSEVERILGKFAYGSDEEPIVSFRTDRASLYIKFQAHRIQTMLFTCGWYEDREGRHLHKRCRERVGFREIGFDAPKRWVLQELGRPVETREGDPSDIMETIHGEELWFYRLDEGILGIYFASGRVSGFRLQKYLD